jgi:hypothetical protein
MGIVNNKLLSLEKSSMSILFLSITFPVDYLFKTVCFSIIFNQQIKINHTYL